MTIKQLYIIIIIISISMLWSVLYLTESSLNRITTMQESMLTISNNMEIIKKDIEETKLKIALLQQQITNKKEISNKYNKILNKLKNIYI